MPTTEEERNRAAYHRFHDAINGGDLETIMKVLEEALHPDARFHAPQAAGIPALRAQRRVWETLLRAFPDIHVELDDLIVAGDKIVARQTVTGTNTGEYRGMPPTGRPVTYNEIFIARFADEKITDLWGVVDLYGQLRQLGAIPE